MPKYNLKDPNFERSTRKETPPIQKETQQPETIESQKGRRGENAVPLACCGTTTGLEAIYDARIREHYETLSGIF